MAKLMENPEPLTPTVWGVFCHLGLGQAVPLRGKGHQKSIQSCSEGSPSYYDETLYPGGSGFFQDIILMVRSL